MSEPKDTQPRPTSAGPELQLQLQPQPEPCQTDEQRKLDRTKRERILAAALVEFVERGFTGASTNAIARRAGVAKGLIFHYFGSKEQLYLTLVEEAVHRLTSAFYENAGAGEGTSPDLFERMLAWSMCKLRLFRDNPLLYQLVTEAFAAPPAPVREELLVLREELSREGWAKLLAGVDTSRFRPGLTLEKAVEVLVLVLDGLERKFLPRLAALPDRGLSELQSIVDEARTYLQILRDGMYT